MSDRQHLRLFASSRKRCSDRRHGPPGARRLGFESLERRTLLTVGAVPVAAGIVNLSANAGPDTAAVMDDGQVAWYNEDGLYFHDGIATTRVDKPSNFYQIDAGNLVWFGPTSEMAAGIFLYDGTDTRLLGETVSPFFQADEGNVAWMGIDGLYLYNGTTTTRLGSPTPSYQLEGGQVVWFEPDEGDPADPADDTSNVYFFDGATTHTLTDNGILPPYEASGMGGAPGTLIDEGKVVWLELASEENTEVRLYDSATEQTKILGLGMFPQIEDGQVAWMHAVEAQTEEEEDLLEVLFYDGVSTRVLSSHGIFSPWTYMGFANTLISDGYVVWTEVISEEVSELRLFDSHASQTVTLESGTIFDSRIDGGQVVWSHGNESDSYVSFYDGTQTSRLSDSGMLWPAMGAFSQRVRAIDNGQVVWLDISAEDPRVRLFDGTTTYDLGIGIFPHIDAGYVTWEGPDPSGDDIEVFLYTPGVTTSVVDRHVFYNHSQHDGNRSVADEQDDDAIAPHKEALLPGRKASGANYTNYDKGINGLMIDIAGLAHADLLSATGDFVFMVGNDSDPDGWAPAPEPVQIDVREGEGVRGSDRVTIVFEDGAIQKQWLQVTVKATLNTGLDMPDVFYFGNAPGEAGDNPINTIVNATDEIVARNFQHSAVDPALIDDLYDYNRDGLVDGTDQLIARGSQTNPLTMLRLIDAPIEEPLPGKGDRLEASAAELAWLREIEQSTFGDRTSKKDRPVATAVDRLLASVLFGS